MIILASASPRRRELLTSVGFKFEVIPAQGEEIVTDTTPEKAVISLASQKAREIQTLHKKDIIIGADTIVYCDGKFLGKPKDTADARNMLEMLSGRTHSVFTGVCIIINGSETTFSEETEVEFYNLSEDDIDDYIATGEPFDKAGAYGIQERGAVLVKGIKGDYYNVMGLPVARVYRILKNMKKSIDKPTRL